MSVIDWVGIGGLAVGVFAATWQVADIHQRHRRYTWASFTTMVSIFVVIFALGIEKYTQKRADDCIRDRVLQIVGGKYFWTFEDMLDRLNKDMRQTCRNANSIETTDLQRVLDDLIAAKQITARSAPWSYGSPPEVHNVTVYCRGCKP
jgi:hypothetical protein